MNSYPAYRSRSALGVGDTYPPYPPSVAGAPVHAVAPIPAPVPVPLLPLPTAPTVPTVAPPTPAPASVTTVTFVAGALPMPVNAAPGAPVLFALPPGATWQSFSLSVLGQVMPTTPMPQIGTSTPIPISTPPGPAVAAATWTDATGAKQVGAAIFLPPGITPSTPITDAATVTAAQTILNAIAAAPSAGLPPGLTIAPVAVNGNAADPGFVQQLGALQQWMVGMFANPVAAGANIAPTSLNIPTNGALDYATLAALSLPL